VLPAAGVDGVLPAAGVDGVLLAEAEAEAVCVEVLLVLVELGLGVVVWVAPAGAPCPLDNPTAKTTTNDANCTAATAPSRLPLELIATPRSSWLWRIFENSRPPGCRSVVR
jgi:hypothetical protein